MKNPVICADGYTYEKDAILLHLRSSPLSPMTRQAVDPNALIPNRALKDAIEEWIAANPDYSPLPKPVQNKAKIMSTKYSITLQLKDEVCVKDNTQDVLCMIVDISGSMNSTPVLKDLSGAAIKEANLSKLEMVRHAVKVAVKSLPLGTHVGIICYDDNAKALVPFTQIAKESDRKGIITRVSKMETHGCTDIYGALDFSAKATIKYCESTKDIRPEARKKMWLLTDGLPYSPNMPVKKGTEIIEGFEFLATTHKMVQELQVSTFGFGSGSQIETDVLEQLSRMTGGSFGYIPDPSMLACNINGRNANDIMSISNEVVEIAVPKECSMECVGGSIVKESINGESRVATIKLRGAFKKGIPRHLYVSLFNKATGNSTEIVPALACTVDEKRLTSKVDKMMSLEELTSLLDDKDAEIGDVDMTLPVLFSFVNALSKKSAHMIESVIEFIGSVREKPALQKRSDDLQYLLAIMHDAKEGKKACETQYWNAWGIHYLRALLSAYECEESLSSRDLGTISLFVNKSENMKKAVSDMETIFKSLTIQSSRRISQSTVARYADAGSTVCFTPLTPVKLADGSFAPIGSLRAGMEVETQPIEGEKSIAKIVTVVETMLKRDGVQEVVNVCEGAFATPYHPIKTGTSSDSTGWNFPINMVQPGAAKPPAFTSVFNLVLDKDHVIFVGDGSVQTVTLAHGYQHGVLNHKFFGTTNCLDHLYKVACGGTEGSSPPYVVVQQGSLLREVTPEDPDGQIVGLTQTAGRVVHPSSFPVRAF